jgi:hypothetical protein
MNAPVHDPSLMAAQLRRKLHALGDAMRQMQAQNRELTAENRSLQAEVALLREQTVLQTQTREVLTEQMKLSRYTQVLGQSEDRETLRKTLDDLLAELDRCIALLDD